jgi:CHAD domain-containing protein
VAYQLRKGKSPAKEVSRVVTREFEKALSELANAKSSQAEVVFEARKHIKKIRAVLRMLQNELGKDYLRQNRRLRSVAHQLSTLRDADASLETMRSIRDHYPRLINVEILADVQQGLRSRKRAAAARINAGHLLPRVEHALRQTAKETSQIIQRAAGRGAMSAGIVRGYRRARKALACVHTAPDDGLFHWWRRRVKDHWYHIRLLEGRNGRAKTRVRNLKRLETWLGDDHNLAMLRATILSGPARFGEEQATAVVLGCLDQYQSSLRRRALKLGERAFAQKPRAFGKSIKRWLR